MRSRNPVFSRSGGFARVGETAVAPPSVQELERMYATPSADRVETRPLTVEDVVYKTALVFAALLAAAAIGWANPGLTLAGLIVGFVLAMVNSFKRTPSPVLILAYAGFEGLFVGGISRLFETRWNGVVPKAVIATLAVFAVMLAAYRSGRIRVTPRFTRVLIIAGCAYLVFVLVNLGAIWLGAVDGPFGFQSGWIGVAIGLFAVGLAALFLVLDFDFIQQGVRQGLPQRYAWSAAFGLVVTLVWLYIELLRLTAILSGDD